MRSEARIEEKTKELHLTWAKHHIIPYRIENSRTKPPPTEKTVTDKDVYKIIILHSTACRAVSSKLSERIVSKLQYNINTKQLNADGYLTYIYMG